MNSRLTVGDGFQFGCGFMVAGCLFYVAVMVLLMVGMGILTLLGLGSMIPQLPGGPGILR
jgi:hypothetical protein